MPAQSETRCIVLQGQAIDYTLRRSQRRTLGLTIDARGLTVSIPLRISLRETEGFITERAGWIIEKLGEWNKRQSRSQEPAMQVADGMQFYLLGAPCHAHITTGNNRAQWIEGIHSREILLRLREGSDPKPLLLRSVQRYALTFFRGRVEEFGHKLCALSADIQIPTLHLTNARTRWGSCSRLSGIRLNWRLIHLPLEQIDYVVAHELAHLLEMNHSERFWDVVAQLYPPYERIREQLKQAQRYIPAW